MTAKQPKPVEDLAMSGKDFDRIMSQVLQVKPSEAKAPKKAVKAKPVRKKRAAPKK